MATSTAIRSDLADHLFTQAIVLPAGEREAFVRACTEANDKLRAAVMAMLVNFDRLSGFLEAPLVLRAPVPILESGIILSDRFRVTRFIAVGGMGEVYEAHDLVLDEPVALKTIRSGLGEEQWIIEQFREEIRLSRKISHRHICRIHDIYEHRVDPDPSLWYLSMELLDGETLAAELSQCGAMPPTVARPILEQVLAGLEEAHAMGIVHRDFKPGNIMLTSRGAVITDFGLAQIAMSAATAESPAPDRLAGSLPYMAPEQFADSRVTAAADLFAFGVVAYEMVSGRLPFPATTLGKAMESRLSGSVPPPRYWRKPILHCLRANPKHRPRSVADVRRQILSPHFTRRGLLAGMGIAAAAAATVGYRSLVQPNVLPGLPVLLLEAEGDSAISPVLDTLLRTQLSQSAHFEILSRERMTAALQRMDRAAVKISSDTRTAREVALREGVSLLISPELRRAAGIELLVRIEKLGSHPYFALASWERKFSAAAEPDLRTAVTEAAIWIRRTVGEGVSDLERRNRRPEEATTQSWEGLLEYVSAETARAQGKDAEAVRLLRQALTLDGEFPLARMRLADILFGLNRPDEAYTHWSQAAKLVAQRHLTDREAFRIRALFLHDTGDDPAAKSVMESWAADFPYDYLPLFYLSSCQSRLGQWKEAIASIEAAGVKAPGNPHVVLQRAQLAMGEGNLQHARALLDSVREVNTWWWQYDAEHHFLSGRCREAWKSFDQLSRKEPEWRSKSYSLKACLLCECGRPDQALALLREGLEFDRATERVRHQAPRKLLLLGAVALRLPDLAKARQAGLDAAAQAAADGGQVATLLAAAELLCRAGDSASAARVARSVEGAPDFPTYRALRRGYEGQAALCNGDPAKAIRLFREARRWTIAGDPADSLAHTLETQGDRSGATELWSTITRYPGRYWLRPERYHPAIHRDALTFMAPTDALSAERLRILNSAGSSLE